MKILFILFLSILSHFVMAQDVDLTKGIDRVDSFINTYQFDKAKKTIDSLYKFQHRTRTKDYKVLLLELKFRDALLLDEQNVSPTKILGLLIEILEEAQTQKLNLLASRVCLLMALTYEKAANSPNDLKLTDKYLNEASNLIKKHKLDEVYSSFCIRKSSYHRYKKNIDSTFFYANEARISAKKFGNNKDLIDSYILLGAIARANKNYDEALKYSFLRLNYYKKFNIPGTLASNYNNISETYLNKSNLSEALKYNDSAYLYYDKIPTDYKSLLANARAKIFEMLGNTDSALYYFKEFHENSESHFKKDEYIKVKEIEEQYQNEKKEATIQSRNSQILLICSLFVIIAITSVLIIRKNRKISSQNKIIKAQLTELSKILEQKQMLLSELQHRVKNNLQQVISILEIQKESIDYNGIDEIIRSNQNRIHSMALLHKKSSVLESVNEVNLKHYITELAELVTASYINRSKINLRVQCDIETFNMEKALPIGLIIVELVSNSIKHAFNKQKIGIITIEVSKGENENVLYYADNGIGCDFNQSNERGLGQEIVNGLIDQFDGTVDFKSTNGFELSISFK